MDIFELRAVHIVIGMVVILSGITAFLVKKGSRQHKLAGQCFVISQVIMGIVVLAQACFTPNKISSLGILFTCLIVYLVMSAWLTIHRLSVNRVSSIEVLMPFVALCITTAGLVMGFDSLYHPSTAKDLPPTEAYFFFSAIAFIAMILDVRHLNKRGLQGKQGIVRHVWRMSFALCFAVSAPFSQGGVVLTWIRENPVLSISQMLFVIVAIFWMYRLLFARRRAVQKNITTETAITRQ